jgi:hypothetical protein
MYLQSPSQGIITTNIKLRNCYTGDGSGGIYATNTVITETDSTFSYLSGLTGGVIRLDVGTLHMTNTIINNVRAYTGGSIYLLNAVTVTIDQITVTDSEARYDGGFLYISGSTASSITFSN